MLRDLEGVSTYAALLAEPVPRGWSNAIIGSLAGGNVLRVTNQAV